MENKELFKNFYKNCKKIDADNLRLDDCRIVAIIDSLRIGETIPLASASYTDADSNSGIKNASVSVEALYRVAYTLFTEFKKIVYPIKRVDSKGTHTEFQIFKEEEKPALINIVKGTDSFKAEVLKGDIKRPSSAKSATASTSASKSATASTSASKPATASKATKDDKEEKTILIVEKLSDIIKNRLKVSASQLAEIETAFMEVLNDNL